MPIRWRIWLASALATATALYAFQRPFRQYPGVEYDNFPLPSDWQEKAEWTFARLMYPQVRGMYRGYGASGYGDWTRGYSMWTQDYPAPTGISPRPCAASPAFTSARSSNQSISTTETTCSTGPGSMPSRWDAGG